MIVDQIGTKGLISEQTDQTFYTAGNTTLEVPFVLM